MKILRIFEKFFLLTLNRFRVGKIFPFFK